MDKILPSVISKRESRRKGLIKHGGGRLIVFTGCSKRREVNGEGAMKSSHIPAESYHLDICKCLLNGLINAMEKE